ncbi:hypothetical protein MGN70_000243 [Eutypa lata]|nr:hypothetical protein MGN70_000243 [Eutypa lata]
MALADGMKTESPSSGIEAPERLYSTPLSWERPQLGVQQMDPYMSTNSPSYNEPQDRQRLLAIAMGSGQTPSQLNTNQPTAMDFRFDMNQSPTTMSDRRSDEPEPKRAPTKPRMPSRTNSGGIGDRSKDKPKSSDRAAHNDIERKYRTNLKDRIAELRDAIPSLRAIPDDADDMATARAAPKVSKVSGTVECAFA